jgi:aspartyl protease family protein
MIGRALLIWTSAIVVAINVPSMVSKTGLMHQANADSAKVVNVSYEDGRIYVLRANEAGHFEGKFRLNGKPMQAMVDTGATFVTMNEGDARNLGFGGNDLTYKYEVMTANGKVKAARVMLKSIEIGTVAVRNVDALVVRGRQLEAPLIGMSFMKKLSSYSADGDEMKLVN